MNFNKQQLSREEFLALARAYSAQPGTTLFYSGGAYSSSRCSFLCLSPEESIVVSSFDKHPWNMQLDFSGCSYPEWVGYFSYEMGAFSDPDKQVPYSVPKIPLAFFYKPSIVVEWDHISEQAVVHSRSGLTLDDLERKNFSPVDFSLKPEKNGDSPWEYCEKVSEAKELIQSGDVYQVNLSQEFTFKGGSDPFELFCKVSSINPAPFMAYMRLEDFALISSSPERFLQRRGDSLETRPIKGTSPRGKTARDDRLQKEQLLSSVKERAELLMITDLMRNDLGRISLPGSVETEKLWHLESYQNVHHLLSIIRSTARSDLTSLEMIRSCFPGGSITGCPKLRAMEAIHSLEMRSRGIYTGSIGYFTGKQDFDFNIAIRTLLWTESEVNLQLGGAVVADSDPENEYLETFHKGQSLFHALQR
jgi:para-aminobenzoate synthetase component I